MKTTDATFAARLRHLRAAAHFTQGELAEAAGLDPATVSLLESGKRQPAWDTVVKLCEALECSTELFR